MYEVINEETQNLSRGEQRGKTKLMYEVINEEKQNDEHNLD